MHDVIIVTGADEDRVAGRAGRGQGGVWLSILRSSYKIWLCLHMVSLVYNQNNPELTSRCFSLHT